MVSAISSVRRLWVMMMNCVRSESACSASLKRPTLDSSSAASTSSRTQMGEGLVSSSAKRSAMAVSERSPPESMFKERTFLRGGWATMSTPASACSSSVLVSSSSAWPPPKNVWK